MGYIFESDEHMQKVAKVAAELSIFLRRPPQEGDRRSVPPPDSFDAAHPDEWSNQVFRDGRWVEED